MEATTTILGDNLDALERRFGFQPLAAGAADPRVRVGAGPAGITVEIDAGAERWLRLLSARDPFGEAARWVADWGTSDGVAILVGGALGYAGDVLEAGAVDRPLVVVEPSPRLARLLLERRDWRAAIDAGRLAVVCGPDYAGLSAIARHLPGVAEAEVLVHPVVQQAWPEETRQARAAAERLRFEARANAEARRTLGARYLRQTLGNALRIAREGDAASLTGLAAGRPAVIAAAGPSLDRNIHDLHLVRDRAVLIACDTALRPLLSLGVAPDLAVALDPTVANACHLGALHDPRTTWLVAEASLHASAFTHFDGRTFGFRVGDHEPWPWLAAAGLDRTRLEVWGSVVTAAFDLAVRMGCRPIVFVGADLAFTDGRPYCRGTTLEAQWASWVAGGETYARAMAQLVERWPAMTAADIAGRPAHTASHLLSFRDWLVTRARALPAGVVINATGAGVLHGDGIRQASAADVLGGAPILDAAGLQRRLAAAHRATPRCEPIFARLASLEARGWEVPPSWRTADPGLDPAGLRAILEGPEYRAWRLGRRAAASSADEPLTTQP